VTKYLRWKAHSEILETEDIIKDWIMRYEKPDFLSMGNRIAKK